MQKCPFEVPDWRGNVPLLGLAPPHFLDASYVPGYCCQLRQVTVSHYETLDLQLPIINTIQLFQIMSTDRDLQEEVDRLQVTDFASELMNKDHDVQRTFVHTTSTSGMKKLKPR